MCGEVRITLAFMPELRKVDESSSRIRYAHPHAAGWLMAAIGIAGAVFGWNGLEGGARWGALALAALFTYGGVSSALSRFELTFDLKRRRLRYRRGSVFGLETGEEAFDAVERVVLKKEIERKGGREVVDEWEVELEVRGWPRPVEVFESKKEAEARAEAEALARRLGAPLGERTGR